MSSHDLNWKGNMSSNFYCRSGWLSCKRLHIFSNCINSIFSFHHLIRRKIYILLFNIEKSIAYIDVSILNTNTGETIILAMFMYLVRWTICKTRTWFGYVFWRVNQNVCQGLKMSSWTLEMKHANISRLLHLNASTGLYPDWNSGARQIISNRPWPTIKLHIWVMILKYDTNT